MLNSIRLKQPEEGSKEDKILKSREITINSKKYPQDAIDAFAQNKPVFERNIDMLNKLQGEEINCVARDSKKGFPEDHLKTGCLVKELKLKIGAHVMLTNNLDISDGLINGAMGTITQFIFGDNRRQPHTILIKFDNSKIGVTAIKGSKYRHICKKSVPITPYEATFYLNLGKTNKGTRIQFPLVYCWAVTVHKLQGLTLDKIVLDMDKSKGSFRAGQAYVGFSRVKTLEGLYILHYD